MYKILKKVKTFRFRRYSRGGFSAFNSLHREVSIGHVASYITAKQLKKSKTIHSLVAAIVLALTPQVSLADEGEDVNELINLDEVAVYATQTQEQANALHVVSTISAADIKKLPVQTLNDLLNYIPGIDLRTRGANGVQADLSMHGGTFDQVVVLLNGVNFTDTQTGHASLDIPIDISLVDSIEILQNTASSTFGQSFCGAVNIITNSKIHDNIKVGYAGGSHGYIAPDLSVDLHQNKWTYSLNANYNQSHGYTENTDYKYGNLYFSTSFDDKRVGHFAFQTGTQLKQFGSNSFYSLKYPDQFEANKTLIGSLSWQKLFGSVKIETNALYRRHSDRFELFREGKATFPSWYTGHNYHVTDTEGLNLKLSWFSTLGKTTVGAEVRNEHIFSNVLGDDLEEPKHVPFANDTTYFTKSKQRINLNYFVEQSIIIRDFSAAVALSGNYNSLFSNHWAFSGNMGYRFAGNGNVSASFSKSFRLPTYTDLYYESATQIANHNLKPEKSLTSTVGVKWSKHGLFASANLYYRVGKDLIDWIRATDEEKWRSVNHTRVDAMGIESQLCYHFDKIALNSVEVSYAYCHLDKKADGYLSKYALDYLAHKLTGKVDFRIFANLGSCWMLTYQLRNGAYTDKNGVQKSYKPVLLIDPRIYWQDKIFNVYIECTNLLNMHYYDYGGIEQPGAWVKAGLIMNLALKRKSH